MNLVVGFKVVPDETLIRVSGGKLDLNVATKISTYDKNAIEEAVRIKEATGGKITGVTVGNTDRKVIREALSMGVDEVVAVSAQYTDVLGTATAVTEEVRSLNPDLVLFGETTTDGSTSGLGPMVAELWGVPVVTFVRSLKVEGKTVRAERSLTPVIEVVETELPAVITVTGEINTPRIPTLRQIMESSKKPVRSKEFRGTPVASLDSVEPYTVQRKRVVMEGKLEEVVPKLIEALRKEGVI
ncbi:electron transfer flavoprotein subunit alpha [Sulfodiicoccus acidiphilus]|uniref:Electron transfer flavoprotein subunit alpha n=1 Tax=Sulfodiicoccus acidiphilus TaxID=1670455 RepID=A0A348B6L7_9CREN|nr:electron transfer flavoprotein subunit beta/FixA family protein [Sulfodiicoccus acidiphilus]BBD73819.1 electron transfer flavoprotein subunit alpha [Sulfodiicoccus acidiphilus]GGT96514.1 electron transfer flavoprotein subunit alpha [Sulfodiicoccus acidiphilus]